MSFKGIVNGFLHFVSIKRITQHDILYLCHDNSRPVNFLNKLYSPLIDSINIQLQKVSGITLALPFSKYSGKKVFGNVVNLNLYFVWGILVRLIKFRSIRLKDSKKDPIVKFYGRLLDVIKPKVIIGIQPSVEICLAAKMRGIKTYDVQHGIIEFDDEFSYYSMGKRSKINNEGFPDYILCRNQHTVSKIKKNDIFNFSTPILIGNLNQYFFSEIYKVNDKIDLHSSNKSTVLVTLQPFYDKEFERENSIGGVVFPKLLLNLIEKQCYNFIIKLHPSQIQNPEINKKIISEFTNLFGSNDNVDYEICNLKPLEFSLTKANLHVTFNSACLFDALDYGVPTVLLDKDIKRLENYFGNLLSSNIVHVDDGTGIDIKELIENSKIQNSDYLTDFLKFKEKLLQDILATYE
ncbi:hypothetical protein EV195_11051 [Tenacibaculum skagerrakense]|uniref:CDP-glycerol:poly(Glycerophosphate) glycerophosphotransferase n=2 Tax=Tenacibaculum skagerrakense TaxID=186571 RepID=A0A4R2NN22_9FLAO|nr:hypothetical protein EV195_11051 [Tenacibaculum skagerrakense]